MCVCLCENVLVLYMIITFGTGSRLFHKSSARFQLMNIFCMNSFAFLAFPANVCVNVRKRKFRKPLPKHLRYEVSVHFHIVISNYQQSHNSIHENYIKLSTYTTLIIHMWISLGARVCERRFRQVWMYVYTRNNSYVFITMFETSSSILNS